MWLDLDRTCEEIARFSRTDAEAYRRLHRRVRRGQGHLRARARSRRPASGPSLEEMLLEHPRGRIWLRRNAISALGRDPARVRGPARAGVHALAGLPDARARWTRRAPGVNAYSIVFGRQGRGWSVPRGGSGALTDALTHFLEDHGSTVLCNRQVSRLVLEDGRCTGVETDDGERYMARRAVLSTIHVKHLVEMAPREAWGEEFVLRRRHLRRRHVGYGRATWRPTRRRSSRHRTAPRSAVSAGHGRLAGGRARARARRP